MGKGEWEKGRRGEGGHWWLMMLLSVMLAGCLPSSCQRTESRALFPADSLSRSLAEQMTPDTLQHVWTVGSTEAQPLAYPRTVRFGPEGRLLATDAERSSLLRLSTEGRVLGEVRPEGWTFPYLAGVRGDTIIVFQPDLQRFDFVVGETVVRQIALPPAALPQTALQYGAASDRLLFVKRTGQDVEGRILALDDEGAVVAETPLPSSSWRYAGMLRTAGDTLLSLSGYRPVIDVLPAGGPRDTLALVGFDSPMLARSRAFALGQTHQAPLLTSSAAAAGSRFFVLNMRPGWLRVDVFGRDGRLQQQLVEPDPGYSKQFYPVDLDVQARPDGSYLLAVAVVEPEPEVRLYRWMPEP